MKVAVIGRTEILYETVNLLVKNNYKVPLIITAPEAPEYKKNTDDFKRLAGDIGASFLCTRKLDTPEVHDLIRQTDGIDIAISLNYSSIISQEIIDRFPLGILNAHGGDLPRYRGNACQAWAIINAEERIGLCIHRMIGGEIDSGDIIAREYMDIDINTKVTACWKWIADRTPELFLMSMRSLEQDKNYVLETQSKDPAKALRCYPRMKEDGRIDWRKSAEDILRLINASNKPYSGAFCFYDEKKLIVWDAELFDDEENYLAAPGQVASIEMNGSIIAITGKGKLKIKAIEYDRYVGAPGEKIRSIRKRLT